MRARLHGVPLERLNGLTQSLTVALPVQPLALPQEVAHYEEYSEAANARQWQRFNEGVSQLLERTLSKQQREQLQHVSQSAAQRVNSFVQHAGHATQELTQQALKATQVRAQQAATIAQRSAKQVVNAAQEKMRSVTEVAQHTADHAAIRMEAIPQVAPEEQFQP